MVEKKLSEGLRCCVEGRCSSCDHWETEATTTCPGLLREAYEVAKKYEEVEDRIKRVLFQLHHVGGCGAQDDYSKGWDEAITEAIRIVEKETGIGIEEVLD